MPHNIFKITMLKNTSKAFTAVDLFSGCGGLSQGFSSAGFNIVAAVELDHNACTTYRSNFSHPVIEGDITQDAVKQQLYTTIGNTKVDVVIGGPPCQGFSTSGKRNADAPRNKLFHVYKDIVSTLQPQMVLLENVKGITTMSGGKVVEDIRQQFADMGYTIYMKVLNAADYGVPQLRERVIFIGCKNDCGNPFPEPLYTPDNYVSVATAIGDLESQPFSYDFSHECPNHSLEMKHRLAAVKEGEGLYTNRKDSCRKLYWSKPAFTIKGNHGNCAIHPHQNRTISVREMSRLQSFPDDFDFSHVAKQYQYLQVGNAVPPLMAKHIANKMLTLL